MQTLFLDHPLAAIAVCCFGMIQVGTFGFLVHRAFRVLRELQSMAGDTHGSQNAVGCADLPFTTWCQQPTQGAFPQAQEQRRDTALAEVDQWFTGLPAFQLLTRSGHVAPLLGVLITAFGFLGSKALAASDPAEQLLRTVSPLVLGIAGGALLAILSQVFLFAADTLYGWVRHAASECFGRLSLPGDHNTTTQALKDLVSVSHSLQTVFADVPTKLTLLMKGIDRTDKTLTTVGTVMEGVATRFTGGVSAFEATVSSDLTPLLRQHAASIQTTRDVADQCKKSLSEFASAAQLLEKVGLRQAEISEEYAKSLSEIVLPTHRQLSDTAKKVTAVATSLGKPLDAFVSATSGFANSLAESTDGIKDFKRMAEMFGQGVQTHFLPAIEAHHSFVINLEAASAGLRAAKDSFAKELAVLATAAESHRDAGVRLVELIEEHTVPAHELLSGCAKRFEETSVELSHFADGYNDSVIRHAEGVDSVANQISVALSRMTDASERMSQLIASVESRILNEWATHSVHARDVGTQEVVLSLRDICTELQRATRDQGSLHEDISRFIRESATVQQELIALLRRQPSGVSQPAALATAPPRRPQLDASPANSPEAVPADSLDRSTEAPQRSTLTPWWPRRL